ncbi:MAG TPA: carboxypeptidase-like regulatory domain-containing protein [Kofleriaceae bacterium]|nr:carboxypeptidase-like regulatory domain-containing protein [Kofleriaceae bacterium]
MKRLLLAFVFAACGPTSRASHDGGGSGTGSADADLSGPPPTGSVSGTVWAPANAIGMVPAGYEIPVAGAIVYVTDTDPMPIPDAVYCDRCDLRPPAYATTDAKGKFTVAGVSPGHHELVVEKAQFRIVSEIVLPDDAGLVATTEQTTLPSIHDPAHGKWIPRVAIATGDSDHVEDIFAKMGILGLGSDGAVIEASLASSDRVELWGNPIDPPYAAEQKGTITELFGDLNKMKRYHIIFVPCNYESDVTALAKPSVRKNIQDYVALGGKLYVTDWSAEWEDAAFPDFIAFDDSTDTTASMAAANNINAGDGDFGHFAMHAKVSDATANAWLDGQKAPLVIPAGGEDEDFPSTYAEGVIDANDFVIEQNWSLIRNLPSVTIGTDMNGMPVKETAKTWITGDYNGSTYPHTVTFEPSCGRVLYSTYHTAQKTHQWLVPQERVLLHLIMEIGVCNDGPIVL